MADKNKKGRGTRGRRLNIVAEWRPGSRTQSWDALLKRILGDVLQADGNPTKGTKEREP